MTYTPTRNGRGNITDEGFIAAWQAAAGSPAEVARLTGLALQNIYARRNRLEAKGVFLETRSLNPAYNPTLYDYTPRLTHAIGSGCVVIGSDLHSYHPSGVGGLMVRAFAALIAALEPRVVVLNGDVIDGRVAGRHGPEGGAEVPSLDLELQALEMELEPIERAAGRARLVRTVGNHDKRFDAYFAARAPDARRINGIRLRDHTPRWDECMAFEINGVVVKHRYRNGVHAGYNNALHSGRSIVTGHTHALSVWRQNDFNGVRYGVQDGMLADPTGPQFQYQEGNPSQTSQGCAVLTWAGGVLLPPELCQLVGGVPMFRGKAVL